MSSASGPLVVAAGGGGDGCSATGFLGGLVNGGGPGGAAGAAGGALSDGNAEGGGPGTSTAGGAGGAGGTGIVNGNSGMAGSAATGGTGGAGASGAGASGGGGGGGVYGGGGGGQGATAMDNGTPTSEPGAGGGGGSSLVPPGGTLQVQISLKPLPPPPQVVISYNVAAEVPTFPGAPPTTAPPTTTTLTTTLTTTPPSFSSASQSHRRWRLGSKLARFAAARKPPVGTTFRFTLNEAATVRFAFAQLLPGRKVNGKCVAQTARNRRRKACVRSVPRGSLAFSAGAGVHKLLFQGRLTRTRKLKPGTYTLTITATNAAGQRASKMLRSFTIVPG